MPDTKLTPRRIADAYVEQVAAQDPATAQWLGDPVGLDRLPDLSPEGYEAKAELDRGTLALLDAAPAGEGPVEAACARLLRERLTAELACHDAGDHFIGLRTLHTPVQQLRRIFTLMDTGTADDWSHVANRLRALPDALDGFRTTLSEGISRGLLSAPRQVDGVIEQLTAWTGEESGTASWFTGFVADGPERQRAELDEAALRATAAIAEFRDWLRSDYAPAAVGVPDAVGRERYLRSARRSTGADVDLAEAYAWGWSEFHRTLAEMEDAARRVLPGASLAEAVTHLNEHGHRIEGEEGIRSWLQELIEEAIEALDGTHFDIAGPLRRVETLIAPPGSSVAPHYSGPSMDFGRPGRTYLPTLGQQSFPTWRLVSTWYHEGVPGHHLQLAQWVTRQDELSRYQVTLGKVSANVEGWALYAERLMHELGFLADPGRYLGYLGKQMLRIIRVIIDIGMHLRLAIPADSPFHPGEQWTPELGLAFMAAYEGSTPARQLGEVTRYLGLPGQAIGYKLGERAWLAGRAAAQQRRGAAFDLKSWHMAAISQGSFGLDDLTDNLAGL
ncbi:DUF885 domain-containing protein [Kitasatospora sp. NBC_01250]|uniref:DUF885 domain-containing protein n=1 Tax=unclassified Kitasatospora TaxID=2633591 RepID=UPI002E0DD985|nr:MULTISPECIES: DUF885 domain-containing protein [unclassified Kitasatospora]WSJ68411.1 DUF885 domain-containing protein [Kitasatospora sp. NBC_01302]